MATAAAPGGPARGPRPHLGLGRPEGRIEATLQGVQEGLDLVEAVRGLAGAEGHDVEVLEDLLEAGLAHDQRQAAVAVEAAAPDAEDRLAVGGAGGDDVAQERLHLRQRHVRPGSVAPEALLELLGVQVGLHHHVLEDVVRDEELEEVHGAGAGGHLPGGTWTGRPSATAAANRVPKPGLRPSARAPTPSREDPDTHPEAVLPTLQTGHPAAAPWAPCPHRILHMPPHPAPRPGKPSNRIRRERCTGDGGGDPKTPGTLNKELGLSSWLSFPS